MSIDWEKLRKEEWPVLETMTFLDAACVSFAPQRSVRAVKEFAETRRPYPSFTDYVGGFRISCQYFNNKQDIDNMIAGMEDLIKEIGRAPDYKQK